MFSVHLIGAARPAWTPYADPCLATLAATYRLLLDTGQPDIEQRDHATPPEGQMASGQQR